MTEKKQHKQKNKTVLSFSDTFAQEHPYPILRLNKNGSILYANPASMPVLVEWELEVGDIVHHDILNIINQVLTENIAHKLELEHGHTTLELTFSASSQGRFVNVFGQDITIQKIIQQELITSKEVALKALKETEEIQKSLEEAELIGKYGNWEWSIKNNTIKCSKGFFNLLKFSQTDNFTINDAIFFTLLDPEDQKILRSAMEQSLLTKQPFTCNYKIRTNSGETIWLHSEGHPLVDESKNDYKLVGTAQDITEKIKNEIDLADATLKAESATRSKALFLANMSHEIRTPMNGIIGMCNLLLGEITTSSHKERLKIIQNCGNSLLNLINDVLDFSKLEAGKIELENEPFQIHQVTQEVLDLLHPKASDKKIFLNYVAGSSVPEWISGDTTRFRQILTNLVSNAIKFTEQGGVEVLSSAKKINGNRFEIQFSIKDTGIGITQSALAKLFHSFSQADASTTRRFGGTGLGLAISKGLCEQMGGNITVTSEPGKGSTFSFTLILTEATAQESDQHSLQTYTSDSEMGKKHPLNILIAEDNRVNQLVVIGFLEKLGYHPDVAGNGFEVLDNLTRKSYDLILMDYHMPEMDGLTATKKIHEIYTKENSPRIVALTASAMKEDVDRCFAAGMNDFISKPIQLKEIYRVLNATSNRSHNFHKPSTEMITSLHVGATNNFQRDIFLANYVGLEDILNETIDTFLSLHHTLLQNIENAIEENNTQALALAAQTLKGAVSNFFSDSTILLAWELEQIASSGSLINAKSTFEKLKIEIENLCNVLLEIKPKRISA